MTIEERLQRLERTVRHYQLGFIVLGLVLLVAMGIASTRQAKAQDRDPIIDGIKTRMLEIVDDQGRPVITMLAAIDKSAKTSHGGFVVQHWNGTDRRFLVSIGADSSRSAGGQVIEDVRPGKKPGTRIIPAHRIASQRGRKIKARLVSWSEDPRLLR